MTHPCNNPNLSPIEFLEAVTHDDTFSIALRAKAAKALTLIHTKAPVPPITINKLRPDLAHVPIPEPRMCRCGHWLFGPCPLGERCRERSKLN